MDKIKKLIYPVLIFILCICISACDTGTELSHTPIADRTTFATEITMAPVTSSPTPWPTPTTDPRTRVLRHENITIAECINLIGAGPNNNPISYVPSNDVEYEIQRFESILRHSYSGDDTIMSGKGYTYFISYTDTKGNLCQMVRLEFSMIGNGYGPIFLYNGKEYRKRPDEDVYLLYSKYLGMDEEISHTECWCYVAIYYSELVDYSQLDRTYTNPPFDLAMLEKLSLVPYYG